MATAGLILGYLVVVGTALTVGFLASLPSAVTGKPLAGSGQLGASVAAGAAIVAMREPGTRRSGVLASLRPQVGVPRLARGTFATAVPCLIAVWALSGLYQSLGPSLAAQVTGSRDLLWGGLLVFLLTGIAAAPRSRSADSPRARRCWPGAWSFSPASR
jgi:hypothetical protein